MAWIELHQGLREHRKLFACADELKVSRIQMIGILVSLWLWALDNTPDGSLKDISSRTIARVCDFSEKKADALVSALHQTGWIDKSDNVYYIHDWFDYAGKLMERREKDRERKKTGKGIRKISAGVPPEHLRNSCATVPNRTVPNQTEPIISSSATAEEDIAAAFERFWNSYPNQIAREDARQTFRSLCLSAEELSSLFDGLARWKRSVEWSKSAGQYIPRPAKWLSERRWQEHPKEKIPKGASGQLGQAELEAINHLFREGLS